jgi:hypothetical protein
MKKIIAFVVLAFAFVVGTAPVALACGGDNCATTDGGGCSSR